MALVLGCRRSRLSLGASSQPLFKLLDFKSHSRIQSHLLVVFCLELLHEIVDSHLVVVRASLQGEVALSQAPDFLAKPRDLGLPPLVLGLHNHEVFLADGLCELELEVLFASLEVLDLSRERAFGLFHLGEASLQAGGLVLLLSDRALLLRKLVLHLHPVELGLRRSLLKLKVLALQFLEGCHLLTRCVIAELKSAHLVVLVLDRSPHDIC